MSLSDKSTPPSLPRREFLAGSAACASTLLLNSPLLAQEKKVVVKSVGETVKNIFNKLLEFGLENASSFVPFAAQADQVLRTLYPNKNWPLIPGCYGNLDYLLYRIGSKPLGQAAVLSQQLTQGKPGETIAIFAPPSVAGMDYFFTGKSTTGTSMEELLSKKANEWLKDPKRGVLNNPRTEKARSIISQYILPPLEFFIKLNGIPREIKFSSQQREIVSLTDITEKGLINYEKLLALQAGALTNSVNDSKLGVLGRLIRKLQSNSLRGASRPLSENYSLPQFYLTEMGNLIFVDYKSLGGGSDKGTTTLTIVPDLDKNEVLGPLNVRLESTFSKYLDKLEDKQIWEKGNLRYDLFGELNTENIRLKEFPKEEVILDFKMRDFS